MEDDFSNFPYLSPSETSSVTGEYSHRDTRTDTSSIVRAPTNERKNPTASGDSLSSVFNKELQAKVFGISNPEKYTCYMNSAYSLLAIVPKFMELFQKAPTGLGSQILTEIRSVFSTKDPKSILKIMHRCLPGVQPGKHHDSAEFLDKLLEKLAPLIPVDSLFGLSWEETSTCFKGNHGEGSYYSNRVPDDEQYI